MVIVLIRVLYVITSVIKDGKSRTADGVKNYCSEESQENRLSEYDDGVDESLYGTLYQSLIELFEREKPYLNPVLKITDVSEKLGTNKTYLSRIIAKNGVSYTDFIHKYRIMDCLRLYSDNPNLKMEQISYMVGYRNHSTFNKAFLKFVGKTPAAWEKSQKKDRNEDNQRDSSKDKR
jgi:AraC-like DNA-binding protein